MSVQLKEKLRAYLNEGERRLLQFYEQKWRSCCPI